MQDRTSRQDWVRLAGASGVLSVLCYFGAALLPLPEGVSRLLAFAFGPLLIVSFSALYRFMARRVDGPVLQIACLFGIIAGVMVTTMLVVQIGNNMVRADMLANAGDDAAREAVSLSWTGVNRVQYLLDVVWDIFICVALVLLAAAMVRHPRFGWIWGGVGVLFGLPLLVLNLHAFPYPPAEAGSVDLGPLAALWMLAVFLRTLLIKSAE